MRTNWEYFMGGLVELLIEIIRYGKMDDRNDGLQL